jgi:hypothetical protein
MGAGCIGPGIVQRLEASTTLGNVGKRIEQVSRASRQSVEPCHNQDIASLEALEHLGELRSIAARTANLTQPAAFSSASCEAKLWPSVETRA